MSNLGPTCQKLWAEEKVAYIPLATVVRERDLFKATTYESGDSESRCGVLNSGSHVN